MLGRDVRYYHRKIRGRRDGLLATEHALVGITGRVLDAVPAPGLVAVPGVRFRRRSTQNIVHAAVEATRFSKQMSPVILSHLPVLYWQ